MERPAHVPDHLVVDFDYFGSQQIGDAHAQVRQWRTEKGPVVWSDLHGGHWIVIGVDAVREGLTDIARFDSASGGTKHVPMGDREPMVPIELDGVEHAEYRRLLNPLFAPNRVRLLDDEVRKVARALLDDLAQKGEMDVPSEFARPLASSMFLGLVDWPLDDREQLEHWVELELNGIAGQTPEENQATQTQAMADIAGYCADQVAERRRNPREDMTSLLMEADIDGEQIPDGRLVGMLMLLMIAGLDTTQSVTSQGVDLLGRDQEKQQYLRQDPSRIPIIVEELLRLGTPANPNRRALCDTELGGVPIKKGDRVSFMLPAASRDPQEFERPDQADFDREVNRHSAFGLGPHKCIGSALARVVLAAGLDELHQAIPPYTLVSSSSHLGGVWGMNEVRITWEQSGARR